MRRGLVGKVNQEERAEACRSEQAHTNMCYVEIVMLQLVLQIIHALANCPDDRFGLLDSGVVCWRIAIWSGRGVVHCLEVDVPLSHLVAFHAAREGRVGTRGASPSLVDLPALCVRARSRRSRILLSLVASHRTGGGRAVKRRKVVVWVRNSLVAMLVPTLQAFFYRVIANAADLEAAERVALLQSLADWSVEQMRESMRSGLFLEEELLRKRIISRRGSGSGKCLTRVLTHGAGMLKGLPAPFHLGDSVLNLNFPLTPSRYTDLDRIIESQRNVGVGGKKLVTHRATVYNDEGNFRMMLSVDGGLAFPAPALAPLPARSAAASSDDESGADSADESDPDSADSDADDSAG